MFEEDVRSEQFESNTFKPRYPVYLNDPNNPGNGTATAGPAAPPPTTDSNNLYPSAKVSNITPAPPTTNIKPSAPPTVAPYPPSTPSAPAPAPAPTANRPSNAPSGPTHQPSLEVLGFSIPPDYEPTETPISDIGWK